MGLAIDAVIVVLILGMTWALMSEGLWGAALMFFNILFASLITFNFYEPLANLLATNMPAASGFADTACLTLIFLITLVILRVATESMAPTSVRFPNPVYHAGRVLFGFAGSMMVVAIMLLAFHTAPIHRKMFSVIDHDTKPPFGRGLDRWFLGFIQYTTGYPFSRHGNSLDPYKEFGDAYVFDRQGRWLIDHEDARPYGDGWRESYAASSGGGASSGAGSEGGQGLGIPGGTAGAAAGLAPTQLGGGF
jgi:uncharacterized membrane protein required for colicin V production